MGRWFVSPGVTVDKLEGRLTPVGFTGPHVRALRDVLVWIGQGAPMDYAEAPAVGAVPGDYDDPSDAEERSRIDQLIADQLDGGDESGSEASLESDDDDEYSSSSESGEDGYELAEDDEKEELAHVEEKMQQERSITADVASPLPPSNGGLLPSENQLRGMEMAAEHAQIEKDCDEVRLPPPYQEPPRPLE